MSSSDLTGLPKLGNVLYQTLVEFPQSAYSVQRVPDQQEASSSVSTAATTTTPPNTEMPHAKGNSVSSSSSGHPTKFNVGEPLAQFCQSTDSISSLLAADPNLTPGQAWKKLSSHYKHHGHESQDIRDIGKGDVTDEQLEMAYRCGKWGNTRPSKLFLRLYHDSLCTLNDNPAHGMVSPSLLGSSGVAPLAILSVIPDIVRHMSNLIVRAEKEVFLATNYWQNSTASQFITDAMKELSRRAGERGSRVVMKVLYDRGSPRQLLEPHYVVPEKEYTGKAVGLPHKHEIPNIDLEVMNYHDPMLGTFHSKFMVVDRKIGIVQSNNIQDNDNMEMMVHVEGAIVDSLYDMALMTWHKKLDPPLPSLNTPASQGGISSFGPTQNASLPAKGTPADLRSGDILQDVHHPVQYPTVGAQPTNGMLPEHTHADPHYDADIAGEMRRVQESVSAKPNETQVQAVSRHLNHTVNKDFPGDAPEVGIEDEMTPYMAHPAHEPFPIAMVNRQPYGPPNHKSVSNPQNAAWLSALRNAEKSVFIQTPTLNAEPLVPAIVEACERGIDVYCYVCLGYNDAGELLPMQGGHNEMIAAHLYKTLSLAGRQRLHYYWYVGKDQTKPIVAERKKRSCHVKLMIVDDRIAVVGSGNQDTQSWFHSQEVNLLMESPGVCAAWIDGLRRNQNTAKYGTLSRDDGVWRGPDGKEADGATGVDPGRFSWAKGVVGAIQRVRGEGGF
ncbi:hypothetical protein KJ359_008165 [Pestalotiopsis sp. 9143b]|nr:hypothetical protein KJ359_008165 [Pestalotiopsis sp. 9143b]